MNKRAGKTVMESRSEKHPCPVEGGGAEPAAMQMLYPEWLGGWEECAIVETPQICLFAVPKDNGNFGMKSNLKYTNLSN